MDMWAPYVASVREYVRDGDAKIVFDKFHIANICGRR
jgi:transposase